MAMDRSTTYVEVIHPARDYSERQLDRAVRIAWILKANRFVLVEQPENAWRS